MTDLLLKTAAIAATAVGLSLPWMAQPAQAFFVTYNFEVNVYSGQYTGSYTGSFRFDQEAIASRCFNDNHELVPCAKAAPNQGDLTLQFNFLDSALRPRVYTEQNDVDYYSSGFPAVYLINSNVEEPFQLSLFVAQNSWTPGFLILGKEFYVGSQRAADYYRGDKQDAKITYTLAPPPPDPAGGPHPTCNHGSEQPSTAAVPEPSEMLGSVAALGILGTAFYLRRRKTAATIDVECEDV